MVDKNEIIDKWALDAKIRLGKFLVGDVWLWNRLIESLKSELNIEPSTHKEVVDVRKV